ncbi:MAG: CoA transferase [Dehalococcoidia bacterium]|nr:CoA transferase [Dehalococcoidia bacterium]
MMTGKLPLSGVRVVDFGWVWAGTLLGSILGSYGAEVIKIESKRRLDGMRLGKVFEVGEGLEKNPFFQNLNRNKLSMTMDMSKDEGVSLLKELVKKSSIVIENFAPGVLARRGLDYRSLEQVKQDIIMVSLSPMGQHGPLANLVTYAPIISALSGIDSLVGYPGESPIGFKHAYADVVASICALFALLVAVRHHNKTGEGQYIDLSQGEAVLPSLAEPILDYQMSGRVRSPRGNNSEFMAPHGVYPCAGDDKWVSIAVKTDEEWRSLCGVLGNPPWTAEPSFANLAARITNAKELDKHIGEWTSGRDSYDVTQALQNAGVAAAPVLDTEGVFLDPQFNQREAFVNVEHPITGNTVLYNWPWKMASMQNRMQRAPLLGEHNNYVLGEVLGLPEAEIQRFIDQQVVY